MNKLPNRFQYDHNITYSNRTRTLMTKYGIDGGYFFDCSVIYTYKNGSFCSSIIDRDDNMPILTYEEIEAILEPKIDVIQEYVKNCWVNAEREIGAFDETYTIEQLKTERIAVKCITEKEVVKLYGNSEPFREGKPSYIRLSAHPGYVAVKGYNYSEESYTNDRFKIINYNQINFMANIQKPIIGYKLKNKKYLEAAKLIAENKLCEISFSERNDGTVFSENSIVYDKLKTAGILELWFDAVYESEEKTIVIGNNNVKLVINGDEIKGRDIQTNYKEVNSAYLGIINNNGEIGLGGYALYFDRTVRWIRVGCTDQNNLVSINEIESVLNLCQSGK